jgi:hypothetical protein
VPWLTGSPDISSKRDFFSAGRNTGEKLRQARNEKT